jgi:hypothetical protein
MSAWKQSATSTNVFWQQKPPFFDVYRSSPRRPAPATRRLLRAPPSSPHTAAHDPTFIGYLFPPPSALVNQTRMLRVHLLGHHETFAVSAVQSRRCGEEKGFTSGTLNLPAHQGYIIGDCPGAQKLGPCHSMQSVRRQYSSGISRPTKKYDLLPAITHGITTSGIRGAGALWNTKRRWAGSRETFFSLPTETMPHPFKHPKAAHTALDPYRQ